MTHQAEIAAGQRFSFGKNWARFLNHLGNDRIAEAEKSLMKMLETSSLHGRTFLDIGSGSGLFSLAARRLGARVHSFDFDPSSVACTEELRRRYYPDDPNWKIEEGSALDEGYLRGLGAFDIVYCWGVLHHSGQMWRAIENIVPTISAGGLLYLAIYNSNGYERRWKLVKRTYCRLPNLLKSPFACAVITPLQIIRIWNAAIRFKLGAYLNEITSYGKNRGMSWWHDQIDWLGGYPYETAAPEQIFDFFKARGLQMEKMKTCGGGIGCNEFLFKRCDGRAIVQHTGK